MMSGKLLGNIWFHTILYTEKQDTEIPELGVLTSTTLLYVLRDKRRVGENLKAFDGCLKRQATAAVRCASMDYSRQSQPALVATSSHPHLHPRPTYFELLNRWSRGAGSGLSVSRRDP